MENEEIFRKVVRTKKAYQAYEKPFVFPDHPEWGVTFWDWTLAPILNKDRGVEFLVFSLFDVTERKRAREKLIDTEKELQNSRRLADVGTLAATVAHELRNPLAAIHMAASNITRKAQDPRLKPNLESIQIKINESEQIIDNLLYYSRLKSPTFGEVRIFDVVRECLETSRARSGRRRVSIELGLDPLRETVCQADVLQMKELFSNILNNAMDAVRDDDGVIEVSGRREGDNALCIKIHDNGPGIAPENLKKVFDPFFTTKASGTGLGLSVCYQIAQLHGGALTIDSHQGQGTTVQILLPLRR